MIGLLSIDIFMAVDINCWSGNYLAENLGKYSWDCKLQLSSLKKQKTKNKQQQPNFAIPLF